MAQYCDTKNLERLWFEWAMASGVPSLEPLRQIGALYSRVKPNQIISENDNKVNSQTHKNPWLPLKEHVLILQNPMYVTSDSGLVNFDVNVINARIASTSTHDELLKNGYHLEPTTEVAWKLLFLEVQKMCEGISRKFSTDQDIRMEIEQESLVMVIEKLHQRKVRYTPGLAPVFNFLTTAIYRCIFNHLRKNKRSNSQMTEILRRLNDGNLDTTLRSYQQLVNC